MLPDIVFLILSDVGKLFYYSRFLSPTFPFPPGRIDGHVTSNIKHMCSRIGQDRARTGQSQNRARTGQDRVTTDQERARSGHDKARTEPGEA